LTVTVDPIEDQVVDDQESKGVASESEQEGLDTSDNPPDDLDLIPDIEEIELDQIDVTTSAVTSASSTYL
jgi:hypothetical protein